MAFKDAKQCKAHSKSTGERCRNPAVIGFEVCRMHGAHGPGSKRPGRKPGCEKPAGSGGPAWRNANARKHGAYSAHLPPEEMEIYDALLAEYMEDIPHPTVTDRKGLARLAVLETKWNVAVTQGAPPDALDTLSRMLHRQLNELQVTRRARGASATKGTSPAEIFADILARVRQYKIDKQREPTGGPDTDATSRQDE